MSGREKVVVENSEFGTFTYKWETEDWPSEYSNRGYIESPEFEILDDTWYLQLHSNGRNEESKGYVCIALYRMRSYLKKPMDVRCIFTLTTADNHVIGNYDSATMERYRGEDALEHKDFNTLIRRSTVDSYYANPGMVGNVIVFGKIITQEKGLQETLSILDHRATQHLQAFQSFINNERFSDVKIKVEGTEIFAHKMILSAHSPVFSAMFEHQMLENKENVVTIDDISSNAFYELLRYVYLGKVNFVKGTVTDLFKAADKYQILELKSLCEKELRMDLDVDNMFAYLKLADAHNAVDLKEAAVDFVVNNMNYVIYRPEVKTLQNLDTDLFKMILQRIISKKK